MNAEREDAPWMEASSHREGKITGRIQHLNRLEPTSERITPESVTGDSAPSTCGSGAPRGPHGSQKRQMSHLE